jgi:protein-tyrosine phosphatase
VCLGNICRSPTAHGVFEGFIERRGLSGEILVDSCGTGEWHVGSPPDRRAMAAAARRGYDLGHLRARQVQPADFDTFDYILAMDRDNLADLQAMCPAGFTGHLGLFLSFAGDGAPRDVPDPYYGGDAGFDLVLDLIESASAGLLQALARDKQE